MRVRDGEGYVYMNEMKLPVESRKGHPFLGAGVTGRSALSDIGPDSSMCPL